MKMISIIIVTLALAMVAQAQVIYSAIRSCREFRQPDLAHARSEIRSSRGGRSGSPGGIRIDATLLRFVAVKHGYT